MKQFYLPTRQMIFYFTFIGFSLVFISCRSARNYNPDKKISPEALREDYTLLRNILEAKHPSLYWYTPKDSMDMHLNAGYRAIKDSMTELQFGWRVLAPMLHHIRCGHTSFSMSKDWGRFIRNRRIPSLPLYMKVWQDTFVITANLHRDSILKKGTLVTSINGVRNKDIIQKMLSYMVQDGYATNVNYQRISTNFPYFHRNVFGIYKTYKIGYIDHNGIEKTTQVSWYNPQPDTSKKVNKTPVSKPVKPKKETRKQRLENHRSLKIDSTTALLTLNTFSEGHLRTFFRRSFREMRRKNVKNLVLDLRSNGGGKISNYVLLSKYIRNTKFKVADTAAAIVNSLSPYTKHISAGFWNSMGMKLFTKRQKDGRYHFGYWERQMLKPKTTNHFDGDVYVLINGLTFSASTLFCNTVKGQSNVTLVGEETGGGWHGNTGVMIPDITLPNSKLRVRLPLFRLVNYNHVPKDGSGVIPDVYVPPTVENVRKEIDGKIAKVRELISKGIDLVSPAAK
jgi:hypothetical protein